MAETASIFRFPGYLPPAPTEQDSEGWIASVSLPASQAVPSVFYSALGHALALREGRLGDGLTLCEFAVRTGFRDADNFANLAKVYRLCGNRARAAKAIFLGLRVQPTHPELQSLHRQLGVRRPPAFPWLTRSNPLNRWAGRIRHALSN